MWSDFHLQPPKQCWTSHSFPHGPSHLTLLHCFPLPVGHLLAFQNSFQDSLKPPGIRKENWSLNLSRPALTLFYLIFILYLLIYSSSAPVWQSESLSTLNDGRFLLTEWWEILAVFLSSKGIQWSLGIIRYPHSDVHFSSLIILLMSQSWKGKAWFRFQWKELISFHVLIKWRVCFYTFSSTLYIYHRA